MTNDINKRPGYLIRFYAPSDRDDLLRVWEDSVLATHLFLSHKDFLHIKSLLQDLDFSTLVVHVLVHADQIAGFVGTCKGKIEMLFLSPAHMRLGLGRLLVNFSIDALSVSAVDVNEQNINAVQFYRKAGFSVVDRSELDDLGLPYPILKMRLKG